MVHPDDVRNDALLEKLEDKERYILLVNEYCIRNCSLRALHYAEHSREALDFGAHNISAFEKSQRANGCMNLFTLLTNEQRSVLAMSNLEIAHLREMGFRHFKLQGRGHTHAGTLLSDMLRLVLRNDDADENTMHEIGHRFWESI